MKQKFGDWTQRNNFFFDAITENNLYGKMVDRGEVELTGIDQVTFNLPVIRRISSCCISLCMKTAEYML